MGYCRRQAAHMPMDEQSSRWTESASFTGSPLSKTPIANLMDAYPDATFLYDTTGHVVMMNRLAQQLFGVDSTSAYAAFPVRDRLRRLAPRGLDGRPLAEKDLGISRLLAGQVISARDAVTAQVRSLDGRELEVSYTGAPIRDERGVLIGAFAIIRDLTEQRRHLREEARVWATAEARARALSETNRRMDQFLGIVSHELRTPLTVVSASLQLAARRIQRMLNRYQAQAPAQEQLASDLSDLAGILDRALGSATRQGRLVFDLLDVSRIKSGKLELRRRRDDLRELALETVEELRANEQEREIKLAMPDRPIYALVDPDRVHQVVTNFVSNALKYSAPDTAVLMRLERRDDNAYLSVRDEGPGIPIEQREHIWEVFYRAPGIEVRSGSGIGLGVGLHISKTIIEMHGGQVGVSGEPGEGSTFWFTLPLAPETLPE